MQAHRRSAALGAIAVFLLIAGCSARSTSLDRNTRLMRVDSVKFDPDSESYILLLRENGGEGRELLILIGENEAYSIAGGIEEIRLPRPNTHDLIKNLLAGLEGQIERVVVTELRNNTFYALIHIVIDGRHLSIDARPSDAIAIAVRTGAEVFAHERLLRAAGEAPRTAPAREIEWRPASF